MKRCPKCEQTKSTDHFYVDISKGSGFSTYCKPCAIAKSEAWRHANRDRRNELVRLRRRRDPEKTRREAAIQRERHREQRRSYGREKYQERCAADPEGERERRLQRRNPQQQQEIGRRWRQNNPLKNLEKATRYRARKVGATVEKVDPEEVLRCYGMICHICKRLIEPGLRYPDPYSLSFDHVIPLVKGGSHSRANIRPSHLRCNLKKGTK